jgi:GNAT superfamily N-acetyltransferase
MRIREFDPARDAEFLRRCVIELQNVERRIDPRLPAGPAMVEEYLTRFFERCEAWDGLIFVADAPDGPLGLVSLLLSVPSTEPDEPAGEFALISDLVVVGAARGRGIGAALLEHAEARARRHGAGVLRLEVMAGNRAARRFYAGHGFRDRVVQMEKRLAADGGEVPALHGVRSG